MQEKCMDNARIFNIQKFSIHDGPGIRTVVFFKGCPLRCSWCSNPESQSYDIQLVWKNNECNFCEDCGIMDMDWLVRKGDKLEKNSRGSYVNMKKITEEEAKFLKLNCKKGLLDFEGYDKSIDDILFEVKKDMPFYEESGGGVTVSGGEVLYQAEIATKFLKKCKESGIHTAAETTCFGSKRLFKEFVEQLDLLLCDVKHWNEEKAKKFLGVSLRVIIENIKYATTVENLKILCRVPVIPGFNYSLEDAEKLSELILSFGLKEVQLLPFHNYGENKYKMLNREYKHKNQDNLHKDDEKFLKYKQVFIDSGLCVK